MDQPPRRIIVDIGRAVDAMREQTLFEEKIRETPRVMLELLTQSVDFLSDATPKRNLFKETKIVPYVNLDLIYSRRLPSEREVEELKKAFLHLYVNVRDNLEQQCGASKFVEQTGGFNYVLERRIGQRSALLRHLNN